MKFVPAQVTSQTVKRPLSNPGLQGLPSFHRFKLFAQGLNGQLYARLIGQGESLIRLQHAVDDGRGHLRGHDLPSCSKRTVDRTCQWDRSWLPTPEPSSSAFA